MHAWLNSSQKQPLICSSPNDSQQLEWYAVEEKYDSKNKVRPGMKDNYIWMPKRSNDIPVGYSHFSCQKALVPIPEAQESKLIGQENSTAET